jgi:glycosyltransferase involved in cell wall biosynthesis
MTDYKKAHPKHNILIINHNYREGHIAAYNEGIELAEGEYFHLMAADDRLVYGKFYQKALEILTDEEIGFVTGRLAHMDTNGHVDLTNTAGPSFEGKWNRVTWLNEMAGEGNIVCGGAVILRKKTQQEVGGYDKRLPFSADFLNWIRVLDQYPFAYSIPNIVYHYRRHFGQMTSHGKAPQLERDICQAALAEVLTKHDKQLDLIEEKNAEGQK